MTDGDGIRPPDTADKSLGEIVGEVSDKATLLVREEIELAKAEISTKVTRLGKGAVAGAAGGVFLVFALIYFFFGLAFVFVEVVGLVTWVSFMIVTVLLLLMGAGAGLLAYRLFKRGAPPTPDLAIEEARLTREALEEARH